MLSVYVLSSFIIHILCHTVPKGGALHGKPFKTSTQPYAQRCAEDCLSFAKTKCLSFNYVYGKSGRCELLDVIEGQVYKIHAVSSKLMGLRNVC